MFLREHRLYHVDFLIRRYGFAEEDILFDDQGNLSLSADPKEVWATRHPEFFPVRINSAPREALLRVPGLGPVTVKRILARRKQGRLRDPQDVKVKGKRRDKILAYASFE